MEKTQQNLIGAEHGQTGSSLPPSVLAARLANQNPVEMDRRLADGLARLHSLRVEPQTSKRAGEPSLMPCSVPSPEAVEWAEQFLTPATDEQITLWAADLLGGVRAFSGDAVDRSAALKAFVVQLRSFPADCLREAFTACIKFGPKVQAADVAEAATRLCNGRRMVVYALRWALANREELERRKRFELMTDQERAANKAKIAEMMRGVA